MLVIASFKVKSTPVTLLVSLGKTANNPSRMVELDLVFLSVNEIPLWIYVSWCFTLATNVLATGTIAFKAW